MGEPDTPADGPRPDESVLEELAQAFHHNREEVSEQGEPTARSHDHGWKPGSDSSAGDTPESDDAGKSDEFGETNLDDAPVDDIPVADSDELGGAGSGGEVGLSVDDEEVGSADGGAGSGGEVGPSVDDEEVGSADGGAGSGGEVGPSVDDDEGGSADGGAGSGGEVGPSVDDDEVGSADGGAGSGGEVGPSVDDDEVGSPDGGAGSGGEVGPSVDDDEVGSPDGGAGSGGEVGPSVDDDEVGSADGGAGSGGEVGPSVDDDEVGSAGAGSRDDGTQLSTELPAVVGEVADVDSDGDEGDEPAGREGGMIGEPTVARRTIRIVDELPDDTIDGDTDISGTSESDTDDRRTIHIGADEDELPDAVYLDEELERDDGSSGTVFIDDEGVDDALAPKDATRPGIEPRLRQRRIGVRRAASRRRLWWALGSVVIVLVIVGGLAVLGSPLFSIDNVKVTGAQYTEGEVLDQVISDLEGSPVLTADTGAAEDRLEESPWVESARVRTDFPDTVTIEIREREPLLTMRGVDGLFRVLDREGRVLASIEGQPVAMVLVEGPGTLDVEPGSFTPIGYASAASLVTKLTPTVRARVDHVLVTADGSDLRLILTNEPNPPIEVEFGSALGDNEQVEKLVRLERILEDIGTDPVTVINVSTADVTVL